MSTLAYKFADEAAFSAVLPEGVEAAPEMSVEGIAVSVIGIIYDHSDTEEPVAVDGWHVNAIAPIVAWSGELLDPQPESLMRIFG